jgi:Glutaredoxin-like domain (DUF836)
MPGVSPPLPELVLYTRPGCHLCEDARASIQSVLEDRAAAGRLVPTVTERDISRDPDLLAQFGLRIPVVELGDRRLELAVSSGRIRRLLNQTLDEGFELA